MVKYRWDKDKNGELTFQNVCQLYSTEKITVNPNFFGKVYLIKDNNQFVAQINKKEIETSGWLAEQTWFILEGKIELLIDSQKYLLETGDYIKIPTGNYQFKFIKTALFKYIFVCQLPIDFPKNSNNPNAFIKKNRC